MTEFDSPQPGTPAFLVEGSTTPQPETGSVASVGDSLTETEKLRKELENDPSNYVAWLNLIRLKEETDKLDEINKVYDDCLQVFPEDDTLWVKYAEYHLDKENRSKVEEIFKACINSKSIKLWNLYLTKFVVKYNSLISGGRQALGNIIKAHEFAFVDVGVDLDADILYDHEIAIVNSFNAINEDQNAEKSKIILQILRRAIKAPTKKIQAYWNQYIEACPKSEIQINSADYLKVKSFVSQLTECIIDLDRNFNQVEKKLDEKTLNQLAIYRKWIEFEKENKMELPVDLLRKRIEYVYILSIRAFRFVPELWLEYSQFTASALSKVSQKGKSPQKILSEGFAGNPTSFALSFALAEVYELENKQAEAKEIYQGFINSLTRAYETNAQKISVILEEQAEETKRQEAALKARRKQEIEEQNDNEDEEGSASKLSSVPQIPIVGTSYQAASRLAKLNKENENNGIAVTLAYCSYMKFVKRNSEFNETRKIFSNGKKFAGHSWHIYSTSAEMEHENGNNKVATKVYELAMKKSKFQKNIEFILDYMNFLIKINDKTNAKALFETSVKNFEGDDEGLRTLYLEYIKASNTSQDDVNTIKFLENRFLKRFPDVKLIKITEERFKVRDFNPVKEFDLYGGFERYARNRGISGSSKKRKLQDTIEDLVDHMDIDDVDDEENYQPASNEPFVNDEIYNLLRILPKASYCQPSMFEEKNLVSFLRGLDA